MNPKYRPSSKKQMQGMIEILETRYQNAICGLNYDSPLMLTVGLILAAQCTDNMVNRVTPVLFNKYRSTKELADANNADVEKIIKSCGFYINKTKSIIETANILVARFDGIVPDTMNELVSLKGIGRKSANIILQECFNKVEGIAVDTHVKRLAYRMGFTNEKNQDKIEKDLTNKIPKKYWNTINHILVVHGRALCTARKPNCVECPLNELCPKNERSIH